jgi:hypothetical protein
MVFWSMFAVGADFNFWVCLSMIVTGIAHLTLVLAVIQRGRALVAGTPPATPREIYLSTVGMSCLPFVLLLAIPPVLVALTALPFVPLLHRMARVVERERAELADAPHVPPRAVVI